MKDLTVSKIDRQNILNNHAVIEHIQEHIGLEGVVFEEQYRFTRQQVGEFFEIDKRTIDRYLIRYEEELRQNGYIILKGEAFREFKNKFKEELKIDSKTSQLGIFNFRAFLNLGMLLTESENAKTLRGRILDIVIDTLNEKLGGSTKYINQRSEDFLRTISKESKYHKEFIEALNLYLDMGDYKYTYYKDAVYKAIFKEDAKEYKNILGLEEREYERDTMYSEILRLISTFEIGITGVMKDTSTQLNRKLTPGELDTLIADFSNQELWAPFLEDARTKMASRDYSLRDTTHTNLEPYIGAMSSHDYESFLGDKSKNLIERIMNSPELLEVFKRLKDR